MKYNKFSMLPIKARTKIIQESLVSMGYDITPTGTMDKKTKKALMDIQRDNGMTPNACVNEELFEYLNI